MEHLLELLSYEERLTELELFSLEKRRLVLTNGLTKSLLLSTRAQLQT